MKGTHIKRLSALLLLLAMLVSLAACGKEETPIEKTARYLQAQIPEPTCAAVGGDWLVFGLARSGLKVPQKYFDTYFKNVEDYIVSVDGVLSRKKNTEYSRVILALTAIGKNPADAAGFNLLLPLVLCLAGCWWAVEHWGWPEWLFLPAVGLGLAAGAQNFWVFCKERLERSKHEKNHRVGFNSHQ